MILKAEESSLIMLDELGAGLDKETRKALLKYLSLLATRKEKIIILISHELSNDLPITKEIALSSK